MIGFIAGIINVVAAGGSFLTLPLLLFLGLPATVANGTNRIGVIAQNAAALWGFQRAAVIDWRWSLAISVPTLLGSLIGAWAALRMPEFAFRRVLSLVMIGMTLATLVHRSRRGAPPASARSPWHWNAVLGFFGVGLYGGFLQAGVGFLILAVTTLAGHDLVRGNAIKAVVVMLMTVLSLVVFAGTGNVDWRAGAALGAGSLLGGLLGVRLALLQGHQWLEHVLTITVIAFALLLWVM